MRKLNIRVVVLGVLMGMFLGGCDYYKYVRTKPTTYLNIKQSKLQSLLGNTNVYSSDILKLHCIEADENVTILNAIGKCDDYVIVDASAILLLKEEADRGKRVKQIRKISNDLFYIADRNCKKFQDKFYANVFAADTLGQFLGLKLFTVSIGVDFGSVTKISYAQFATLNANLSKNLKEREAFKKSIENNITHTDTYTKDKLLVDMIAYDKKCSLLRALKSEGK